MKIIFDCTVLSYWRGNTTGIQRVVTEIAKQLKKHLPGTHLGFFTDDADCFHYSIDDRKVTSRILLAKGDLVFTAGHNWDYPDHHERLLALKKNSILLGTLFHDTIPVLFPFLYKSDFVFQFEKWLKESLEASDIGFAVSSNTKNDIQHYAKVNGIHCPRMHVIRLGDNVPDYSTSRSFLISKKTEETFILSVGTIEYRKNHILLLNAYRYMIERMNYYPPKLYLVGRKGWLDHDIEYQLNNDFRLRNCIEILSDVSDADLRHLYQQAMFTVYPSFYEGWGLPVAESLRFGKPCIASRSSSMLEVAPGLVRHADPYLLQEWVQQILELSDSPTLLREESEYIHRFYQPYSWFECVDKIKKVLIQHYSQLMMTPE